ncbi:hypothetical protein C8F04DRAFT_1226720 [Mycena alexandri]|uniref:Uncharacterized protein n=1 Tax=Mycena alexandri TaxID=1745969 RepID=A0AAD6TPX0_9AGAR|nr:hypothetical protein C8F04DRAFT_1226720 [Mycena alexandri]
MSFNASRRLVSFWMGQTVLTAFNVDGINAFRRVPPACAGRAASKIVLLVQPRRYIRPLIITSSSLPKKKTADRRNNTTTKGNQTRIENTHRQAPSFFFAVCDASPRTPDASPEISDSRNRTKSRPGRFSKTALSMSTVLPTRRTMPGTSTDPAAATPILAFYLALFPMGFVCFGAGRESHPSRQSYGDIIPPGTEYNDDKKMKRDCRVLRKCYPSVLPVRIFGATPSCAFI